MSVGSCPECGRELTHVTCSACGAETAFDEHAALARRAGIDQTIGDRDQTASDRDQTSGDHDQTLSDHDQMASDADQRSSDEDQDAADDDRAAGSDPRVYERTRRARTDASGERVSSARAREHAARNRLAIATERDHVAAARDIGATERDVISARRDHAENLVASRDEILERAAKDRERAADDRERAADDRAMAAADRDVAARERAELLRMRAASADLLKQAATDQLTGARTRFFGLDAALRELERAHRTAGHLALAFVDIDGLKQTNDAHGHLAGDQLLRRVGQTLREHLRSYDVIVRYGGDEFICVLPDLAEDEARVRFDSIAAALAGVDAGHAISFGLSESTAEDTLDTLIARADADLIATRHRARES